MLNVIIQINQSTLYVKRGALSVLLPPLEQTTTQEELSKRVQADTVKKLRIKIDQLGCLRAYNISKYWKCEERQFVRGMTCVLSSVESSKK